MSSKAIVKDTGISVKKIQLIANLVRGMKVSEALITLRFLPSPAAKVVSKVIKSANANAENEVSTRTDDLKVAEIYANEGKTTKRFRARARGRSARIFRRNSHITVVLDQEGAVN
tara:strand:- start:63 stop:407 length:345 start_codon:yes stop_codon:yes gene_type:complete